MKKELPKRIPPLTISRAFGQKSPLINADVQAFLVRCLGMDQWQAYTHAEKASIFESLPQSRASSYGTSKSDLSKCDNLEQPTPSTRQALIDTLRQQDVQSHDTSRTPLTASNVREDSYVKRAVAKFKRDLGDGYYEKTWQDKARRAHQERMEGRFDDYVRQHAEGMFEDDDSHGDNDGNEQGDLSQVSEDGEYLGTSRGRSRGKGRSRKTK